MTFAAILAPWLKALIAFFGLGVGAAAVASPTPKQAVRRQQLTRALRGATVAPLRYQLSGPVVINTSGQIEGSGDSPDVIDPAAPDAALREMARLDTRWAKPIEAYRALHDSRPTQASIDAGTGRVYRYPTRWAILRATVDALTYDDPLAEKYGEGYAITDPTTNEIRPEWLEMVSLYSPSDDDWAATSENVEAHYNRAPSPGVLDYLAGLVDTAGDALALDWRGALRGAVRLSGMGDDDTPTLRTRSAQLSREEVAILSTLRAWSRPIQIEVIRSGVEQYPRTAWEALSGGGTPLDRGISSLGGRAALALRLRGIPELTPASRLLSDDALVLKAVLISRRWPTVNGANVGEWPYSAVSKPSTSNNVNDQSQGSGVNSQYVGPQQ